MFQLRHRAQHPSSSLHNSGSVDDVKVPRMLPAVAPSPGILALDITLVVIQHYNNNNDRLTAFDPGRPG